MSVLRHLNFSLLGSFMTFSCEWINFTNSESNELSAAVVRRCSAYPVAHGLDLVQYLDWACCSLILCPFSACNNSHSLFLSLSLSLPRTHPKGVFTSTVITSRAVRVSWDTLQGIGFTFIYTVVRQQDLARNGLCIKTNTSLYLSSLTASYSVYINQIKKEINTFPYNKLK